jgi:hypothetical protein
MSRTRTQSQQTPNPNHSKRKQEFLLDEDEGETRSKKGRIISLLDAVSNGNLKELKRLVKIDGEKVNTSKSVMPRWQLTPSLSEVTKGTVQRHPSTSHQTASGLSNLRVSTLPRAGPARTYAHTSRRSSPDRSEDMLTRRYPPHITRRFFSFSLSAFTPSPACHSLAQPPLLDAHPIHL